MKKMVMKILVIAAMSVVTILVFGMAAVVLADEIENLGAIEPVETQYIQMEATAYCYGTTRCDGRAVRIGVCAAKPEWYGKLAAVYEDADGKPGEFIGYFECLDTGGDERIKDGRCIDIYNPSKEWCIKFGRRKVLVLLIDGEG